MHFSLTPVTLAVKEVCFCSDREKGSDVCLEVHAFLRSALACSGVNCHCHAACLSANTSFGCNAHQWSCHTRSIHRSGSTRHSAWLPMSGSCGLCIGLAFFKLTDLVIGFNPVLAARRGRLVGQKNSPESQATRFPGFEWERRLWHSRATHVPRYLINCSPAVGSSLLGRVSRHYYELGTG